MIKNYLKIALRTILKHRVFSAINLFGLAVGIACFIVIMLYVKDELSYDGFHTDADRVYRVVKDFVNEDATPASGNKRLKVQGSFTFGFSGMS